MKLFVLLIPFALQTIVYSTAHAWLPFSEFRSSVESIQHCFWTKAGIEVSQEGEGNKTEEEGEKEPDCD